MNSSNNEDEKITQLIATEIAGYHELDLIQIKNSNPCDNPMQGFQYMMCMDEAERIFEKLKSEGLLKLPKFKRRKSMLFMCFVAGVAVYIFGFVAMLLVHMMFLQMVTFPLVLLRALGWPIFIVTGWPQGVPLTMD